MVHRYRLVLRKSHLLDMRLDLSVSLQLIQREIRFGI